MDNNAWFEIENNFWCPCQDKLSSQVYQDHSPECLEHKILMKVSNDIDYLPGEILQKQHGKKRNSVVDEFLANLESLNSSRRRSSSKLLPGFTPVDDIVPSLCTRIPGLEVYLPACFSPTKLEKLESSLDQDIFQFQRRNHSFDFTGGSVCFENESNMNKTVGPNCNHSTSDYDAINQNDVLAMMITNDEDKINDDDEDTMEVVYETAKKFACCSIAEAGCGKITSTSERNLAERLRRSTLNEGFSSLQAVVPGIANNKKISKVNVIKSAVAYIKTLEEEENFYLKMKTAEKEKNKQLPMKLAHYNNITR